VLATTRFDSAENLEQTPKRYERIYNQPIPQKVLGHIAPIQALKNGQETHHKDCLKRRFVIWWDLTTMPYNLKPD
jgi:hypothetical protein